jgi:hypothetical protein
MGPFWLTPKIELRNAGVDTNALNQLGGSVSDTTVALRPGVTVALPVGRRLRLAGTGYLDLNYFARQVAERSTGFGVDGRGEIDVALLTFFGGGGGLQGRERYSIDIGERPLRQRRFVFGGGDLRLGRTTTLTARVDFSEARHAPSLIRGPDVQRALDRDTLTGTAALSYKLTALTTLVGSAEVIEDRFVHQRDTARATRSYRYLGGFALGQRALISGSAMAGFRRFSSSANVPEYTGLTVRVLTTAPVKGTRLSFAADRDVHFGLGAVPGASGRLRNSYVSTHYEGTLALDLPLRLMARPNLGLTTARYLGLEVVGGVPLRRGDHVYTAGFSLLRRFGDSVGVGGGVSWVRRVSNVSALSYQSVNYGVQAELVP